MKIQIRKGVFETNSSSTHSLQLFKGTVEDVTHIIWDRIIQSYGNNYEGVSENEFIKNDVLFLEGINISYGDEESNQYTIIKFWMSKIQFFSMMLYDKRESIEGINEDNLGWDDISPQSMNEIQKTESFKAFETLVKNYCKKQGYNIKEIVFDLQHTSSPSCYMGFNNNIFCDDYNKLVTPEVVTDAFNKIMNDDYIIAFMDEAYCPLGKPEITVM